MKKLTDTLKIIPGYVEEAESLIFVCSCGKEVKAEQGLEHEDCLLREMATRLGTGILNRFGEIVFPIINSDPE